jgi:hypothetical protein
MTATASMDTRRIHGICGLCIARCGTAPSKTAASRGSIPIPRTRLALHFVPKAVLPLRSSMRGTG